MMNRTAQLLIALLAVSLPAAGQSTAPAVSPEAGPDQATPPAADASTVILAAKPAAAPEPTPVVDPNDSGRTVSSKIAADLAAGMPKFAAPTPTPTPVIDTSEFDRPKNDIPRLPKYIVRESRPPVFRNRDLFTSEGLVGLSFKSHPGLMFGNFLGLNSPLAYQMYLDEQRTADMNDLADTAHAMDRGGDKAESDYILQASQETFMRPVEEIWGGPGANGGFSGGGGR
jgi:hypothetical protein